VPAVVVGGGGLGKRSSVSVGWEELGCEEGSFKCLVHTLIAALLLSNVLAGRGPMLRTAETSPQF
jgi:hypothetical protein